MKSLQHPTSIVDATIAAADVQIGAHAHVHADVVIGAATRIGECALVERGVVIGNDVDIGAGAMLCHGMIVENGVTIGARAVFAKDRPSGREPSIGPTRVCAGARIGASALILEGLTIGEHAVVSAGSVVTHDVPHHAIVDGHPSRIVGYVDAERAECALAPVSSAANQGSLPRLRTKGAALIAIPQVVDIRGVTTFAEIDKTLPFIAKRYFVVTDVPGREVRGEHAHKTLHEFLVCLKGSLSVMIDDGSIREEIRLDSPAIGLHVPPQVWRSVYKYTPDTLLLSLCSHVYDPHDYIRDYSEFVNFIGKS